MGAEESELLATPPRSPGSGDRTREPWPGELAAFEPCRLFTGSRVAEEIPVAVTKTRRHVRLGELKATSSNQNYRVSADVDLAGMRSVAIWCAGSTSRRQRR
jgi:hypothetical protein